MWVLGLGRNLVIGFKIWLGRVVEGRLFVVMMLVVDEFFVLGYDLVSSYFVMLFKDVNLSYKGC